jgi:uridine phosphorylase
MSWFISDADLILNKDGSVYHLNLKPEDLSTTIITVGDQDRVDRVSRHFDTVTKKVSKREFVSHIGTLAGKPIMAISTGIGTDNIDILMNELDALANINFDSRSVNPKHWRLDIIRIGTSGSLQKDIPVGSFLVSKTGFGLDTIMSFYPLAQTEVESEITAQIKAQLHLPFEPYCVATDQELLHQIAADDMLIGNTITAPGFYAPQGRRVRILPKIEGMLDTLAEFRSGDFRFTNFEMETSAYYAFARLMGHRALSVNAIIANRPNGEFASNPSEVVDKLILKVFERL